MGTMTSSSSLRRGMVTLLVVASSGTVAACTPAAPGVSDQSSSSTSATPTVTQTPTDASTPPALKTGIVKGVDGWSTYTNAKLGISFRFPTKMRVLNGKKCTKQQSGSGYTFQAVEGVVPSTVIKDGDTFYITQKYGYQPSDMIGQPPMEVYHSCTKVTTTRKALHRYRLALNPTDGPYHFLAITVAPEKSKTQVTKYLKKTFATCSSFTVKGMAANTSGPWRNVNFTCPGDSSYFRGFGRPIYFTNYSKTRYYTDNQLLVMLWYTQVDQIYSPKEQINVNGLSKTEATVGTTFTLVG